MTMMVCIVVMELVLDETAPKVEGLSGWPVVKEERMVGIYASMEAVEAGLRFNTRARAWPYIRPVRDIQIPS